MKSNKKIKIIIKAVAVTVMSLLIIMVLIAGYNIRFAKAPSHTQTGEEREQSHNKNELRSQLMTAVMYVIQHLPDTANPDRKSIENWLKWEEEIDWTYPPEKSSDPEKNIFNVIKYPSKGYLRNLPKLKSASGTDKILFTRSIRIENTGIEEAEMLMVLPNVFPYQCDFRADFFKVVEMEKNEFQSKIKFWPEKGEKIVDFPNSRMGCIKVNDDYYYYALAIPH